MANQIAESIIARPQEFTLSGRRFYIYPETLGVSLLLVSHYNQLGLKSSYSIDASLEALMICRSHRSIVANIIALSTASGKEQALDSRWVDETANYIQQHMTVEDMAAVLLIILSMPRADELIKSIGLADEQEEKRRIARLTGGNSVSFGGRSLYGTLIDAACERYGWSYDYVVWGIPLLNLRLMLADAITSMYVSDENMKKAHIQPRGEECVSAENTDIETLRKLTEG